MKQNSLTAKVEQFDSSRARLACEWLASSLTSPAFAGTSEFAIDVRGNPEKHIRWLIKEPAACKAVEYFEYDCFRAAQNNCPFNDPPLVFNASALLYLLLIAYERAEASGDTMSCLEAAHVKGSVPNFIQFYWRLVVSSFFWNGAEAAHSISRGIYK